MRWVAWWNIILQAKERKSNELQTRYSLLSIYDWEFHIISTARKMQPGG